MLPNFRPQWTARKGAQELYDAYRAAGLTKEDLEQGRYARINHIERLLNTGELGSSLRWKEAGEGKTFPVNSDERSKPKTFV